MNTSIAETFKDGTVFVTGSTGFLGQVLVEKLLRSCYLRNIALFVRSKREITAQQRVANICKQSLFDRLRIEQPNFMNRVKTIEGCIENTALCVSEIDRDWLIENVNFVFHCAATVKFNEPLPLATQLNIQGTDNVLALAKEIKNLKGFVHVSTAYSHCNRDEIKEEFYPVPITANELKMKLKNNNKSIPEILDWPNTYTFTKAITENLISENEYNLPISIFRPSIIGCTKSEPEPGWVDNMNGATGIITPVIVGLIRVLSIAKDKKTDNIPVDYTVNALISIMWDTIHRYQDRDRMDEKPKIFNYVCSVESPLLRSRFIKEIRDNYRVAPPLKSMWYIFCFISANWWAVYILRLILHRIPAMFVDMFLILSGKRPKLLKLYSKVESMLDTVDIFMINEWKFENSNTQNLWLTLSEEDQKQFWFSFKNFDWTEYMKIYVNGIKKNLLHENDSNVKEALIKSRRSYNPWSQPEGLQGLQPPKPKMFLPTALNQSIFCNNLFHVYWI